MKRPFERLAVIGSGTLGSQIAVLAASAGYAVTIFDMREGVFRKTVDHLCSDMRSKGIEPFISWKKIDVAKDAVEEASSLEAAVRHADFIVEAVPENLDIKRKVFGEMDSLAPRSAIFATNSSSIPVSRIEDATTRPEKCINTHFYMPLRGWKMVDIMGGTKTTPETIETGKEWIRSLGCVPLTVKKEILGFCFNRVWRAVKRECLYMWAGGFVEPFDIDRAWMIWTGMPLGPFAIMDSVGLDVVYDIEMSYFNESGDAKDHPRKALKEMLERGELGVKTGKGFYRYPDPEYKKPGFLG